MTQVGEVDGCGDYCAAHHDLSTRQLSVLIGNAQPLAKEWVAALIREVRASYDFRGNMFALSQLFRNGFNLGDVTHQAFYGETQHFNVTPRPNVTRETVQGLINWWQPKIDQLRSGLQRCYQLAELTDGEFNQRMAIINQLQALVEHGFKPLVALFDKYPDITTIVIDRNV